MDMWTVSLVTTVVGILSSLVALPAIVFSFIYFNGKNKLRKRELDIEEQRLHLEERRVAVLEQQVEQRLLDAVDNELNRN